MASTLPDDLVELLAEMYGEANPATNRRWNTRDLAAFCALPPWGITTTHAAVQRAIKPLRELRAELTREVLKERINATLPTQLESLDQLIAKVAANAAGASPMVQRKGLDTITKALAMKLRFSGVTDTVDVNLSGSAQGVADFLGLAFGPGGRPPAS